MAVNSFLNTRFLLVLLLLTLSNVAEGNNYKHLLPNPKDCQKLCKTRCSATSHKKPCKLYCNNCCNKCKCVPPGTSGNKQSCPCYNSMKTKEGKPKCP